MSALPFLYSAELQPLVVPVRNFVRICGTQRARSIQPKFRPVLPGKEDHLKRWTSFFETFAVGPNRPIEFWTEISGNILLNGSRPKPESGVLLPRPSGPNIRLIKIGVGGLPINDNKIINFGV